MDERILELVKAGQATIEREKAEEKRLAEELERLWAERITEAWAVIQEAAEKALPEALGQYVTLSDDRPGMPGRYEETVYIEIADLAPIAVKMVNDDDDGWRVVGSYHTAEPVHDNENDEYLWWWARNTYTTDDLGIALAWAKEQGEQYRELVAKNEERKAVIKQEPEPAKPAQPLSMLERRHLELDRLEDNITGDHPDFISVNTQVQIIIARALIDIADSLGFMAA